MTTVPGEAAYPALQNTPTHVAIIMDGNGRWARARNMPRTVGHKAGVENLRVVFRAAVEFGISILTIYAFSTENWARPTSEVKALMGLFQEAMSNELPELMANGVQVHHLGLETGLEPRLVRSLHHLVDETARNNRLKVNIALNYGGRAEITDAIRRLMADGIPPGSVTEALVSSYLGTAGQPDPDLVIRTAGEMRLSNFLIWQCAYAEYYSTPVFWPDFGREELYKALVAFQQRRRRFGKLDTQPPASENI